MLKHFDHVTVAVTDPAAAIGFFALLASSWTRTW
jgi:hypothetical protein